MTESVQSCFELSIHLSVKRISRELLLLSSACIGSFLKCIKSNQVVFNFTSVMGKHKSKEDR